MRQKLGYLNPKIDCSHAQLEIITGYAEKPCRSPVQLVMKNGIIKIVTWKKVVFFLGVQFSKYIDTKFELGVRTRIYYLISTVDFNNVTLTPVLTYHF